jgi:hypothetical protein
VFRARSAELHGAVSVLAPQRLFGRRPCTLVYLWLMAIDVRRAAQAPSAMFVVSGGCMKVPVILSACALTLLAACGSTQYVMSTKEGRMITIDGKPKLDEKTGLYIYTDSEGKKGSIRKDDVVQVLER